MTSPISHAQKHLLEEAGEKVEASRVCRSASGESSSFYEKSDFRISIPNPHRGDISKGLVSEILREIDIDIEEWERL